MTSRDLIIFAIGSTTGAVLFVALQLAAAPLARFRSALARLLLLPLGPGRRAQRRSWPRLNIRAGGRHEPSRDARPAMTSR